MFNNNAMKANMYFPFSHLLKELQIASVFGTHSTLWELMEITRGNNNFGMNIPENLKLTATRKIEYDSSTKKWQ